MAELKEQFEWYLAHQSELVKQYNNKYIVIVDNKVVGAYDTVREAYSTSVKKYGLGNFLMQLCTEGDEAYTVTYTSALFV